MHILRSIKIGVKNGNKDKATETGLLGARITNVIKSIGIIRDIITGIISCWASFSEFTVDPIAAKRVEKRK